MASVLGSLTLPDDRTLCALLAGVVLKHGVMYYLHNKRPPAVKEVAKISSIVIFPIKSCQGVEVPEAECTRLGLRYREFRDRHWMIATGENRKFITQRQEPRLTLIKPSFKGDMMCLDAPGMETIAVPANPPPGTKSEISNCWGDDIETFDCGEEVSRWLSKFLDIPNMRLLYTAPNLSKRQVIYSKKRFVYKARPTDLIAMTDYSNYMMASEESLRELNTKLAKPLPMMSFRANIIVNGCAPFSEDKWNLVYINDSRFQFMKECTRCKMTLVDPNTAEVSKEEEPLKTLRSFRLVDPEFGQSPCFGVQYNIDLTGNIKTGDKVFAMPR